MRKKVKDFQIEETEERLLNTPFKCPNCELDYNGKGVDDMFRVKSNNIEGRRYCQDCYEKIIHG